MIDLRKTCREEAVGAFSGQTRANETWGIGGIVMIAAVLMSVSSAPGGDFGAEPFAFRVQLAFDRSSVYPDVTARQASAAHPLGSSNNPASDDVMREAPFDFETVLAMSGTAVMFGNDVGVVGGSATATHRLDEKGTISATYVRTETVKPQGTPIFAAALRTNEGLIGYSERVDERLTLGFSVRVIDSTLSTTTAVLDVDSDTLGVDLTLGAFYEHNETINVGMMFGGGYAAIDTDGTLLGGPLSIDDDAYNWQWTTGVGIRAHETVYLLADVKVMHIETDTTGSVDYGRLSVGGEWFAEPWLAVRSGVSFTTAGHLTPSVGVGLYGNEDVVFEFAYVYNAFPEVELELTEAHLLTFGAAFVW